MKSTPSSVRARRKLSFANLPYHGKSFYLDIKSASLKTRISRRITDLGGEIESFLSKDIDLLITEKEEKTAKNEQAGFSGKQHLPLSRGQALLLQASKNQLSNQIQTSDVLQNASNFGVKLETTSTFLRSSTKLLSRLKKKEDNDVMLGMAPLSWEGKERENMYVLKVEDHDRLYRPLFKQFEDIPKVAYNETGSPFDVGVVLMKQSDNQSTKKKSVGGAVRGGYCESCDHWYRCSLREHLSSNKHREFVSKLDNFKSLKEISVNLPSFQNFLACHQQPKHTLETDRNKDVGCVAFLNDSNNNTVTVSRGDTHENKISVGINSKCLKIINEEAKPNIVAENQSAFRTENSTNYRMETSKQTFEDNFPGNLINIKLDGKNQHERDCEINALPTVNTVNLGLTDNDQSLQAIKSDTKVEQTEVGNCDLASQQSLDKADDLKKGGDQLIVPIVAENRIDIPEASFSSSSCSFGDSGVRNVLTILQNTMSESGLGRKSSDIFGKSCNGSLESHRNNAADVVSKSEISMESTASCINSGSLHEPGLQNLLKENVDIDTNDMPELSLVEQLSETDIETGIMPILDKCTPPVTAKIMNDHIISNMSSDCTENYNAKHVNSLKSNPRCSDNSYTTMNDEISELSNFKQSSKAINFDKREAYSTQANSQAFCQTPTRVSENRLTKEMKETVTNSGSTALSVRNWLVPNEDKISVSSDVSVSRMNHTLVAETDSYYNETVEQEILSDHEDQQRQLVANWISSQKFVDISENQTLVLYDDHKDNASRNQSPNNGTRSEEVFSSRDIQTPVSEIYNELTDLSSIPTDSVISETAFASLQENDVLENISNRHSKEKESTNTTLTKDLCAKKESGYYQSYQKSATENDLSQLNCESPKSVCTLVSKTEVAHTDFLVKPELNNFLPKEIVLKEGERSKTENSNLRLTFQKTQTRHISTDSYGEKLNEETSPLEKKFSCDNENPEKYKCKKKQVKRTQAESEKGIKNCRAKSDDYQTPVLNNSLGSPTVFQSCINEKSGVSSTCQLQQQLYSPISQSSDYLVQNQNSFLPYSPHAFQANGIPNQTSMCLAPENGWNQQFNQSLSQYECQNSLQSYYNTGILPVQNFYSDERSAYYQNISGMQSQLGFSGLSDYSFGLNSPQQYAYNFQHTNTNSPSHTVNNIRNTMTVGPHYQNNVQNFQDISQVDFLDERCQVTQDVGLCAQTSSQASFYPAQDSMFIAPSSSHFPYMQTSKNFSMVQECQQFPEQLYSSNQSAADNLSHLSQNLNIQGQESQAPAKNVLSQPWYLSSPGFKYQNSSEKQTLEPRKLETISLNDIAEDNFSSSNMSFPLGKFKVDINKEPGNLHNGRNKHRRSRKVGKPNSLVSHNKNQGAVKTGSGINTYRQPQEQCITSANNNSYDYPTSACHIRSDVPNDNLQSGGSTLASSLTTQAAVSTFCSDTLVTNYVMPPSVQPLKPTVPLTQTAGVSLNENHYKTAADIKKRNDSNNLSYASAKVGDTKLKKDKHGHCKDGKRTDLMGFWNVKKTGDCRLVFRVNKRKVEECNDSGYATPWEQDRLPIKKRRCLVY